MRASEDHFFRGRRLAAAGRDEEAAVELQVATELNPTNAAAEAELREVRQRLRTKIAVARGGKTELQTLVERARTLPPPGLDLPDGATLPDSMTFSTGSRMIFTAMAKWADLNVVFDPAFRDERITADLRNTTLSGALASLTASTHTFYRVTAPRTITIVPDTPAKRREYEEQIVQTFYLSNADIKEVIDLLRIVVDVRQISQTTAVNAISLKDTPERIAAAGRLITAIDKARPEVVIDVELLEIDRTRLREYGLQFATPGGEGGISGAFDANRARPDTRRAQELDPVTGPRHRTAGALLPPAQVRQRRPGRLPIRSCEHRRGLPRRRGLASAYRSRSRPSPRSPRAASTSSRSPRSSTNPSA